MSAVVHRTEDAGHIAGSLGGDVVEVKPVTNGVHDSEEESIEGNNLVGTDVRIEWNVVVEDCLPKMRNKVASHREEKDRVGPHHSRGSSTSDGHTMASNPSQTRMFSLHGIVVASLDKDAGSG